MRSSFLWDVKDVSLLREGADSSRIVIDLEVMDDEIARKCAVVLQPFVVYRGLRTDLVPVSFYSVDAKGEKYRVRRESAYASGSSHEQSRYSGRCKGVMALEMSFPETFASDSLELYVEQTEYRSVGRVSSYDIRKVACFCPVPRPAFNPDYFFLYPDRDSCRFPHEILLVFRPSFEGRKTSFNAGYADNAARLSEFSEGVKSVLESPQVKVGKVECKAYCGIEGPLNENYRRTGSRFSSVMNCLKKAKVFGKAAVSTEVVGEDWDSVREWIDDSYWVNDEKVMAVMDDGKLSKENRERKLRDVAPLWKNLEEFVFPGLERMECRISFDILEYDDDQQRRKAYARDRTMLSAYDYARLMQHVKIWSSTWYDVVFDFARVYPGCREAQLNACAAAMSLGQYNESSKYLRYCADDENTRYYRALWSMYRGDVDGAYSLVSGMGDVPLYRNTVSQITSIYGWVHCMSPWEKTVYPRFNKK